MKLLRVLFTLLGLLAAPALHAATVTVTNTNDSGTGSLRAALQALLFNGQANTIDFAPGLSGQAIVITGFELTNNGDGATSVTIDASALPQGIIIQRNPGATAGIFYNDGIMTLRALTIRGGRATGGAGGGVFNNGTLTLDRCTLTDNQAAQGGAIYNNGSATLDRCTLSGNNANSGGAIFNQSSLTLHQCTLAGNSAVSGSGALDNGSLANLVHCTVFGNSTGGVYGGIRNGNACQLTLENSIVAGNTGAGGADVSNAGTLFVNGANIVQVPIVNVGTLAGGGTVSNVDPQLMALGNYGGPTQTLNPMAGSPAIDAAVGSAETIDQRGKPRPIDGDLSGSAVADIGSVEFASSNADLASLVLSAGTLSPGFDAAITGYTASVPNATAGLTVTPTRAHGAATITVNGNPVTSGSPSGNLVLTVGPNPINIVVTAQDGSTKTYTVTVTRLSNDANLSALTLSAGTLVPAFASNTITYSASVEFDTTSITVTPTAANANATIKVNNVAVASGATSGSIALIVGSTAIEIEVTAQDGTLKSYFLQIQRKANANLSSLSLSAGALNPVFNKAVTSYTLVVPASTASTTVTTNVEDPNADASVNGMAVNPGAASADIALNPGGNPITVVVTAVDSTTKTYTINVVRPYLVTSSASSGAGSLQEALAAANANPGPDVIVFDGSLQGISTGGSPLSVENGSEVTLDASNIFPSLTLSGQNLSSILTNNGTTTLIGFRLVDAEDPNFGAIFNVNGGTLTMRECTVSNCKVTGANQSGGAVFNNGTLTMERCTLSGNTAYFGGAIYNAPGKIATFRQCTIAENHATGDCGMARNQGTMTLIHCTVFGNTAVQQFPGIFVESNAGASLVLENSIVAGHGAAADSDIANYSTVTVHGANIVENSFTGASGTIFYVNPKLMALGDYGGRTQTMKPQSDSPAIDAAAGSTETIDQRGKPRPINGDLTGAAVADIGAVEYASSNADLSALALSAGTLTPGFAAGTTSYSARVSNATASITITPTAAHGGATIAVNGTPAGSGSATGDLALNVGGNNIFNIVVTAQDGTPKTTTVTVRRNTLPTAPNGTASATTGDQKTIAMPFPSPDADGDPVTLLFAPSVTHLTVNSISGPNVTFTPASDFVGDVALGYFVSDDQNGTATGTVTITISDNDAPVIAAHADVNVIAPDSGGIVVTYTAATATDNVTASPTITYSKESGTVFPVGTTTVTINAKDGADNQASPVEFSVNVHLAAAENTKVLAQGEAAPGRGTSNDLPDDAVIASFGVPATDDHDDIAFVGKWTSAGPPKSKGSGLFLNDLCLGVVGAEVTGLSGAKFKSFSEPVVDEGIVAVIAGLSGVKVPPSAVLSNTTGTSTLDLIAKAGDVAPGPDGSLPTSGAKFKTFKSVSIAGGAIAIFAQLTGGTSTEKATPASDLGVWLKDGTDPLKLVVREGKSVIPGDDRKVKTLVTFATGNGSPGQGRGWLSRAYGPMALALVTFADKSQAVISATGDNNAMVFTRTGKKGMEGPELTDATFASYSFPAANASDTVTFLGSLAVGDGDVAKTNARGIFVSTGSGDYTALARVGDNAGQTGAKFSLLKDPVLDGDQGIAFPATIKGGTIKGSNATTLWWRPTGGGLILLAQAGANATPDVENDLPANAQWKSFTSLAIAGGRGPIFTGTLVPNKGGVTAATATGAWAVDFEGKLRTLFRTGATINGKTLKSFTLLKTSLGSTGVTRNFNSREKVVWLATFKEDKSQAIITTQVP